MPFLWKLLEDALWLKQTKNKERSRVKFVFWPRRATNLD